jgi:hypothetical protein
MILPIYGVKKRSRRLKSMRRRRKRHKKTATSSKLCLLFRSHPLPLQLQEAGESGSTTLWLPRIKVQSFEKEGFKRLGEETKGSEGCPATVSETL